jgi:hypothetical protein
MNLTPWGRVGDSFVSKRDASMICYFEPDSNLDFFSLDVYSYRLARFQFASMGDHAVLKQTRDLRVQDLPGFFNILERRHPLLDDF